MVKWWRPMVVGVLVLLLMAYWISRPVPVDMGLPVSLGLSSHD